MIIFIGIVYGGLPSVKVSPSLPFKMEETYYTCLEHTFASANVKFGTSLCPKIIVISLFVSGQFWFSIYIYTYMEKRDVSIRQNMTTWWGLMNAILSLYECSLSGGGYSEVVGTFKLYP